MGVGVTLSLDSIMLPTFQLLKGLATSVAATHWSDP
jgi:hypothetical protein